MPRAKTLPAASSAALQQLDLGALTRVVPRRTVEAVLTTHHKHNAYRCKLPALLLVYYLILLGLHQTRSTRAVWRDLLDGLRTAWGTAAVPAKVAGKAAIAMARARLGWEVLRDVFHQCATSLAPPQLPSASFQGRRLLALDGTLLAVPDTPSNVAAFGYSQSKHGPSAFPLVRVVGLLELGTHAVLGAALGAWRDGEVTLAAPLLATLRRGDLCLADRLYFSRARWLTAAATGADLLWRLKADVRLPVEQVLPDGSYLTTVRTARGAVRARVLAYTLPGVPDAAPVYRLLTTLLDPRTTPAADLATLYHARWESETLLDEVKTHLRGGDQAVLRSLTADGVRQEVYGLLLAHYVVRAVMADAAVAGGRDPDTVSFTHTVHVLRHRLPLAVALPPSAVVALVPEAAG